MAKRKKKNYRLRKSVRRTLGALFMISAIIIAAIPFPDAAATENGTDGNGTQTDGSGEDTSNTVTTVDLKYGGDDGTITELTIAGNDLTTGLNKLKSYTLVQVGSNLKYEWQYEYEYSATAGGAIITNYNNAYSEKNITLAPQVNTATYVSVDQTVFNEYFSASTNTEEMTVTYDNWLNQDPKVEDFKFYFPSRYEAYNTLCKKYQEYLGMSEEDKLLATDYPKSEDEVKTTGYVKDIDGDEQRKAYYTEYVLANKAGFDRNTHTLVGALEPLEQPVGDEINKVVYILKLTDTNAATNDGYLADDKGFVYSATIKAYELKGIGEGAFKNVKNAMTLKLPDNLLYIADNAFEGSFVTEIVIGNVEEIGNGAFKDSQLSKVTWTDTASTMVIGAEAFKNTNLTDVVFPSSLSTIGEGAFAYNKNLASIEFSDNSKGIKISEYAFYECTSLGNLALENKQIHTIEEGAFAIESVDSGRCTTFTFPSIINTAANLGDLILAGRSGLKQVKMPINLGFSSVAELKEHIFQGCSGLECVEFPDNGNGSSGYVSFGPGMFSTVTNGNFYVKGPALAVDNMTKAYPRTSTWECKMRDGSSIPYMYVIDGKEYYEISDGTYLKLIDSEGILQSCEFVSTPTNIDLNIEGTVGNRQVVGIADGCFSDDFLKYVDSLTIEDDVAIKNIDNNVFSGATNMTSAYIGNLVESIGDDAFNGCSDLKKVTFGLGINSIGARAFKGCSSLEEVEFKQPANRDELDAFANAFPKANIGVEAFAISDSDSIPAKLTFTGVIDPDYGPYAWAMDSENFVNKTMGTRVCYKSGDPMNLTVILDNRNNYPTLVDYLQYKDLKDIPATIKTYEEETDADGNTTLVEKIENINLLEKYEKYPDQLTAMESYIVDSVINVEIPEGIESLDVRGFMRDESKESSDAVYSKLGNLNNVVTYLRPDLSSDKYDSYYTYGLFNGDYENGLTNSAGEPIGDGIGNDVVESVTMYSVKYLPYNDEDISGDVLAENGLSGGAFYDCDNLQTVILGNEMQDIGLHTVSSANGQTEDLGRLPFLGCHKLNNVVSNSTNDMGALKYECINKILYENLDDGSKKIIECLGSRGYSQDGKVSVDNDAALANVSTMAEGAFSDCPELKTVNFKGNTTLKGISDKAFFNDPLLRTVELPENIRNIGQKSLANCGAGLNVWIYGREVSMATDTFDNTQGATVYTYEDTAAFNTAVRLLGPENVEPIPEGYKVQFFDYDGITELTEVQFVEEGGNAIPPEEDPVRTGYIFTGWNKSYKNITEDTDIIALYDVDPENPGGIGGGSGNGNGGGSGSGSGDGNGGNNVNGGIDTDGDGIPDVDADGNKLYKLTVSNGEGSGYYPAGKTVTIKAGNAPSGTTFAYWSCSKEDLILEDKTDWITTLTMISSDVTVTANYTGQYVLEVEYGSGSGSYPAGAKVAISAVEAPQGRSFASWVSKTTGLTIENSKKESTIITMPASHAKVTATYMDNRTLSGNSTKPSQNGTTVLITKPGISDKDKASAYVTGSSDNFIVKISESLEAADEVQRALQKKYPDMTRIKYFAMDISLYDAKGENKITNTDGLKVNITMPIPDDLKEYAGNNRVGAVVNGELEILNPKFTTIDGVPSITFTATHFSPYTIYVDTGNMTVTNTLDSTPKTGDGIHPKWFLSIGLACISIILFTKRDRRYTAKALR